MKKMSLLLVAILFAITGLFAQTPEMFKYQAVLRDASGNIIANQNKTVIIDILQSDLTTNVFKETHSVTTNAQGLISLNIGSIEDLSGIDWAADEYFIQITLDGTVMGTSQLLSVPYALTAKTVETVDYSQITNTPNLSNFLTTETDPIFLSWDKNYADLTNTPNLSSFLTSETDPIFTAWDKDYADLTNTPNLDLYIAKPTNSELGDILFFNGTNWTRLPKGTEEQILTIENQLPVWKNITTQVSFRTCKEILNAGKSIGNGIYTINPDGFEIQCYCDMTSDGGGWTLIYSSQAVSGLADKSGIYNENIQTLLPTGSMNYVFTPWNKEYITEMKFATDANKDQTIDYQGIYIGNEIYSVIQNSSNGINSGLYTLEDSENLDWTNDLSDNPDWFIGSPSNIKWGTYDDYPYFVNTKWDMSNSISYRIRTGVVSENSTSNAYFYIFIR